MPNAFLIKRHTYHRVKLTVACGDGQLNGRQLHVSPAPGARLLGEGCVNALDPGQLLPLTCHCSTTKGQPPAALPGLPSPSAASPPWFSSWHASYTQDKEPGSKWGSTAKTSLPTQPESHKGQWQRQPLCVSNNTGRSHSWTLCVLGPALWHTEAEFSDA